MQKGSVERRRGRRVSLEAPLQIRRLGTNTPQSAKEEVTRNIGLAGVYFETDDVASYAVNDVVTTSVSVPPAQTRAFPFRRLAGRSRVVRVDTLPQQESGGKQVGVALEFGEDLIALSALPSIG